MTTLAICGFVIAGLCGAWRLLAGPSLPDRVIALDVTLISLMGAITVDAARRDDTTNLIMLVVLSIIGFTATVSASLFLERGLAGGGPSTAMETVVAETPPVEGAASRPLDSDDGGTNR